MASTSDESTPRESGGPADDRLDSWKEIAAFLQRDVRTVQRWEKCARLPVHRHAQGRLRTAYAYRSELDAWWRTERHTVEPGAPHQPTRDGAGRRAADDPLPPAQVLPPGPPTGTAPRVRRFRQPLLTLAAAGGLAAILIGTLGRSPAESPIGAPAFEPLEVLVLPFESSSDTPAVTQMLREAVTRETAGQGPVRSVPPNRISRALRLMRRDPSANLDFALAREAALRDGRVRALLTGRVRAAGVRYSATLQVLDPSDGGTRAHAEWHAETPDALISAVPAQLARLVRGLPSDPQTGARAMPRMEPVTTTSLPALRLYTAAVEAGTRHQWGASESLARRAVAQDPEFAAALAWVGWAKRQQGDPAAESRPLLDRAVALSHAVSDREGHLIAGTLHSVIGDLPEATAELEALMRLDPADRRGLDLLIDVYRRAGRAKSALERAVLRADSYPDDFAAVVRAAQALTLAGPDEPRTADYVRRALQLATPDAVRRWPHEHAWLIGLPVFQRWLSDETPLPLLERISGTVLTRIGRDRDIIAGTAGFAYLALERPDDAERVFRLAASPERQLNMAMLALVKGDERAARAWLRQIRQASRIRPALFARVGLTRDAEQGLELAPPSPYTEGMHAVARGLIDARRGRREQAELLLRTGMDLLRWSGEPEYFIAIEELARLAQDRGDTAQVVRLLQRAGAERPHTYGVSQWTAGYWGKLHRRLLALQSAAGSSNQQAGVLRTR